MIIIIWFIKFYAYVLLDFSIFFFFYLIIENGQIYKLLSLNILILMENKSLFIFASTSLLKFHKSQHFCILISVFCK